MILTLLTNDHSDRASTSSIEDNRERDAERKTNQFSRNLGNLKIYNSFRDPNKITKPSTEKRYYDGNLHAPGEHHHSKRHCSDYHPATIFRISNDPTMFAQNSWTSSRQSSEEVESLNEDSAFNSRLFPSMRLLLAVLLCCCYITISISTSNMAVALICMIKCPLQGYAGDLDWTSNQEGLVMAAQNAGSLLMLLTGLYADRINGKWMVGLSLLLCTLSNFLLPSLAHNSFWYAIATRLAIGVSDACMSPAVNSLIMRWFPYTERALAIGIITGGRQIGTLFILPTAGYLCTRTDLQSGWPSIFYLSGLISAIVIIFWLPMGADKPAKQYCISNRERLFIESKIACERVGKRIHAPRVSWSDVMCSTPLWAGVFSLICHEYPLVIMLQFLPNYMRDVLEFEPTQNGLLSAIPILFLLLSKTLSASVFSWLAVQMESQQRTRLCKIFNAVASLGLSLAIACVPQFNKDDALKAVVCLCAAMLFAGLHTPGVQTALLQLAPPFTGIITGISFFTVACSSILNKILTKWIVQEGYQEEWAVVFYISALVAALPIAVFSIWGSDQRQHWATPANKKFSPTSLFTVSSTTSSTAELNRIESKKY